MTAIHKPPMETQQTPSRDNITPLLRPKKGANGVISQHFQVLHSGSHDIVSPTIKMAFKERHVWGPGWSNDQCAFTCQCPTSRGTVVNAILIEPADSVKAHRLPCWRPSPEMCSSWGWSTAWLCAFFTSLLYIWFAGCLLLASQLRLSLTFWSSMLPPLGMERTQVTLFWACTVSCLFLAPGGSLKLWVITDSHCVLIKNTSTWEAINFQRLRMQ